MSKYIKNYTRSVNEMTVLLYLINVIFISLIYNNPFISVTVLLALLLMSYTAKKEKYFNFIKISAVVFLITVMFNLLINQAGSNNLLTTHFLTITQQSLLNAVVLGISFLNILWAFYLYDALVHSKLIFNLLAKTFRSIAIIFVLTVKFIPKIMQIFGDVRQLYRFRNHGAKQKANLLGRIKQAMNLNEIVLNKSIANFMNMSDALVTRGYGGRKSIFSHETNNLSDYLLRIAIVASVIFNLVMLFLNRGKIAFGTNDVQLIFDQWIVMIAIINFLIIIYPLMMGVFHFLWWKLFVSKTTVSNTQIIQKYR